MFAIVGIYVRLRNLHAKTNTLHVACQERGLNYFAMASAGDLITATKELREAIGITQVQFAVKLGKSYSSIQRYETKEPPPTADLAKLALLAREAKQPRLALLFKEAALRDVPEEIIRLIREPDESGKPTKTTDKGVVHQRGTGTR